MLTASERRAIEHQRRQQQKNLPDAIKMSHRERVDALNASLGRMAEHYDIPRVSAPMLHAVYTSIHKHVDQVIATHATLMLCMQVGPG